MRLRKQSIFISLYLATQTIIGAHVHNIHFVVSHEFIQFGFVFSLVVLQRRPLNWCFVSLYRFFGCTHYVYIYMNVVYIYIYTYSSHALNWKRVYDAQSVAYVCSLQCKKPPAWLGVSSFFSSGSFAQTDTPKYFSALLFWCFFFALFFWLILFIAQKFRHSSVNAFDFKKFFCVAMVPIKSFEGEKKMRFFIWFLFEQKSY